MSVAAPVQSERLIQGLQLLCAQPSEVGNPEDLGRSADLIAGQLRGLGMQVWALGTPAAPLLVARRAGRRPPSLLLYHRFDTPPAGPWRAWSHEPFALAERDGALFARGVAEAKGPLAAHLEAIQALIHAEGELPCNLLLVADGSGLAGSPGLAEALASMADVLQADACLASVGARDAGGTPICYSGSKGLLQVQLSTHGPAYPLEPGTAPIVRNPLWRLVSALGQIKGEDEDIRIGGFYDAVDGPTRDENVALRRITLDQAARLGAWGLDSFLFDLSGAALTRAEVSLPTCNLSALRCEPAMGLALLPTSASADLDFQLVPSQAPEQIMELLVAHLADRNLADVAVSRRPGGYPPVRFGADTPFVRQVAAAGITALGSELPIVSAGPFALPLSLISAQIDGPVASVGLARAASAPYGPDEQILLDDLQRHAALLIDLLHIFAAGGA